MKDSIEDLYKDIYRIAREASRIAFERARDPSEILVKGLNKSGDESREIDLELESFIVEEIRRIHPKAMIVTEESGVLGDLKENMIFIIDPLDGSINYATDTPYCSVSIAVAIRSSSENKPDIVAGVVSEIFRERVYGFARGLGAYINNSRVRKRENPEKVVISYFEDLDTIKLFYDLWIALEKPKIRSLGSAALDIVKASIGDYMAFIDLRRRLRNVDIAAAYGFGRSIGAFITDHKGGELDLDLSNVSRIGTIIVSSNKEVHRIIIDKLKNLHSET
ncbi:MAG: inositol monophosphatase [Sulfolobales archaeon]